MQSKLSLRRIPLGIFAILLLWLAPMVAQSADETEEIYQRFDQVSRLRGLGNIDGSLEILEGIIREFADSDVVLRRAYNQFVYTLNSADRPVKAREKAREALLRYPDLRVDQAFAPAYVNQIYDDLCAEMFGALTISEPEDCRVFLDGDHVGDTPLHIPLLLVDTYRLEMFKSGFHAYEDTVHINPSGRHEFSFSMNRNRGSGWWLTRLGIGTAVGTIAAILLINGEESPTVEPEPLPLSGPPPIPTK